MIFIINSKKYGTDKMELVCEFCGFKLWRIKKGNWLLTCEDTFSAPSGDPVSEKKAKEILLKHDLKKYEELFGEIEEA